MKVAVLTSFGAPLQLQDLPDPQPASGAVVIDVVASGVAGYAGLVFNGSRNYALDLPVVPGPGGVGRVRAVGPDATRLQPGDWVFCDSTVRSRDQPRDTILQGWTYRTEAARPLHRVYHHGAWAEQMLAPIENVTPLGMIEAADAPRWCALGRLLVPFGGLLAGGLVAGETLLINGATGGFGGAGVAVALAMGVGRVVAAGRNQTTLAALAERHGTRVVPAAMTGDPAADARTIAAAAGGAIDLVLDFLPREASAAQAETAIRAVGHGGRVVLMGGLRADLAIDYNWLMHQEVTLRGAWMYAPSAVAQMVAMVRAGTVDLDAIDRTEFALADVNAAIVHAAHHAGPRQLTVLRPDRL